MLAADTNAVSEAVRLAPNAGFMAWFKGCPIAGMTAAAIDALLAAHSLHAGLTIVTCNAKDSEQFVLHGLRVLSPWS